MSAKAPRSQALAWAAWTICSIFYAYQYILRVMPNILMEDILTQFDINAVAFGQLSGVYYIGYALIHLPLGFWLDHYGPKKVLPLFMLMTVAGLLPLILAEHWIYPIAGRALTGIGSAAAILGTFKIIRMTFQAEHFSRMLSFSVTIGLLGAVYGGGPLNYLFNTMGYHAVIVILCAVGVILSLVTYLIVPPIEKAPRTKASSDLRAVLTNTRVISVCMLAGLMLGPLEGFADVWGTRFLKQVYGLEGTLAASLPSIIFVGMCFGAPLLNFFAEKSKSYFGVIIVAGLLMGASFIALILNLLPVAALAPVFALVGVCSGYQILAIYKASTYVEDRLVGLTTAVANMIIMLFGYVFHTTIGLVVDHAGGPNQAGALIDGMTVIPIGIAVAIVGFMIFALSTKGR